MWVIPMLALVFCLLGGRNDGSPLVAINLKAARRVTAAPFLMLATAVALLPAANSRVGGTIVAMVSSEGSGGQSPLLLATVLVAASATLLALNGGGVPTSITLALVGASSGAGFAGGHPQWHLVGKEFDPNFHNAVMHVEDEEAGENIVVEEFQKGYTYKDLDRKSTRLNSSHLV